MLELKNLAVSYKASTKVFENVNKRYTSNEFVIIKGPSGAGKSTYLATIGGYLKPTSGKISYKGKDLYSLKEKDISLIHRLEIGYIPQSNVMLKNLTIIENVISPYLYGDKSLQESQLRERGKLLLKDLGLLDKLDKRPNELSGGELKRVAIARALVMEPEILLADEPTTGLDGKLGKDILDYLYEYSKKEKLVIVSTHDEKAFNYEARIEDITGF